MIICDKCGKENSNDRFICRDCGRELVNRSKESSAETHSCKDKQNTCSYSGGDAKKEAQENAVTCPSCKKEIAKDSVFCNFCGKKVSVSDSRFCRYCGSENPSNSTFCSKCGRSWGNSTEHSQQTGKKDNFKRAMLWIVGVIALLIIICVSLTMCAIGNFAKYADEHYRNEIRTYYKKEKQEIIFTGKQSIKAGVSLCFFICL